jgi:hypothetical protein
MKNLSLILSLALLIGAQDPDSHASGPDEKPPSAGGGHPSATPSTEVLAAKLRDFIIQELPDPLFEEQKNWGHTASVPNGLRLENKGQRLRAEVSRTEKNHGTWRKIKVTAVDLPKTFTFDIRDVRKLDQGRTQFNVVMSLDSRLDGTQQNWSNGIKLYDGSLRAKLRIKLNLECETTTRIEPKGWLVPDLVFRLKVNQAKADYDHFVTEHIGGLGGDAAKTLGDALQKILRPAIERKLLPKAQNAIVKAADTKEVRVSLSGLVK